MAIAYGAADPGDRIARRAAVIIGPDGRIKAWFPKVASKTFPQEALAMV
jgi:peroxiredoxin Q/BCP